MVAGEEKNKNCMSFIEWCVLILTIVKTANIFINHSCVGFFFRGTQPSHQFVQCFKSVWKANVTSVCVPYIQFGNYNVPCNFELANQTNAMTRLHRCWWFFPTQFETSVFCIFVVVFPPIDFASNRQLIQPIQVRLLETRNQISYVFEWK